MISLGSREEVVFILHVKRRDRGFTWSSFTLLRLEKRDDSFEKKEVRDDGPSPEESAPPMPPPAAPPKVAAWFRGRFCPLWNVERLGTLRGKGPGVKRLVLDADPVGVAAPDDAPAVEVPLTVRPEAEMPSPPMAFVFSFEEDLDS